MDIFISFSGEAREEYATKFLDFFHKYGLHGWYDQHELFLGDNLKETIINKGIEKVNYCILIINKKYLSRSWPCEEAIKLYQRFKSEKEYVIFPILLDISKEELKTSKLDFLLQIKYQFLHSGESVEKIGFQILNRIFIDMLRKEQSYSMDEVVIYFKRLSQTNIDNSRIDMYNTLNFVLNFSEFDYKCKAISYICLIQLFDPIPYKKTIFEISRIIYTNQEITFDIYKIVESIFLLSASTYLRRL